MPINTAGTVAYNVIRMFFQVPVSCQLKWDVAADGDTSTTPRDTHVIESQTCVMAASGLERGVREHAYQQVG